MTRITVRAQDINVLGGYAPTVGAAISVAPYTPVVLDQSIISTEPSILPLVGGEGVLDLNPLPVGYAYTVRPTGIEGLPRQWVVIIPIMEELTLSDLIRNYQVDPRTLAPVEAPEAAWWAEVEDMRVRLSPSAVDELVEDAVDRAISDPSGGRDIWPILGQSNALGRGVGIDTVYFDGADPRVKQLANLSSPYPDREVAAAEPLFHHELPAQTVGFALTFAKLYADTLAPSSRKVLLVPCAHGNTGFGSTGDYTWRVGQTGPINLFSLAVAQIDKALALNPNNRVAGFLWHQGEANTGGSPATYATDLDAVIDALRTRYGADLPFIIGQMTPSRIAASAGYAAIDAVHRATVNRRPHVGMWLGVDMSNPGDPVHYSAEGQRYNGATAFAAYLLAKSVEGGIAPAPVPVVPPVSTGYSDMFERADSNDLGTTLDGKPYVLVSASSTPSFEIVGGRLSVRTGSGSRPMALVDGLAADGEWVTTIGDIGAAAAGYAIRARDANNYLAVMWRQTSTAYRLQLVKRVAGVQSAAGTGNVSAADKVAHAGAVIRIRATGSTIVVNLDGEDVITVPGVTDFLTDTLHGFLGDTSDLIASLDSHTFVAASPAP